jgi:hypothetical protein
MLYHEIPKNVNQLFAMIVDQKINDDTYLVTSKNYFTITNTFTVLGKKLNNIIEVKILEIFDKDHLPLTVVNQPMSKLTIRLNKQLDLQPLDMLRIKI